MNKIQKVFLLFQVAFFFLSVQQAQGESYLHRPTGILFPEKIMGLENVRVTDYEASYPGFGVGVSYRSPTIKADVYLYTGGLPSIPDGVESTLVTQHFQQICGDIYTLEKSGSYHSVERLSEGKVSLGTHVALSASFSYFQDGVEQVSYIYLTGYKNHFLKIRFTYHKSAESNGKTSLNTFLGRIGELLANSKN